MSGDEIVIREGKKSDCIEIRRLIQELADFEKIPDGPRINHETLENDGFETNPPLFWCYVVEAQVNQEGERNLIGYALYYYTYSTWNGKKMYLEDIYIAEKYRNKCIGEKLFKTVAKRAKDDGCAYLEFSVLSWNPACSFYEKFGAVNVTQTEKWNRYHLSGEAFLKTAQL